MKVDKQKIEVKNPYTNKIIGYVPYSTLDDVKKAVQKAAYTFKNNDFLAIDRYKILNKVGVLLKQGSEDFARLICQETGKPIRESRVEVERACTTMLWSAQESLRINGIVQPCDVTPQRLTRNAYVHRVPLGVIAVITPFNFPLNIPAHKIGPALAAGNAVILKPSSKAPLSTTEFIKLFSQAGLSEGMLNMLYGDADVVEYLVKSELQAVTFTGSTYVGMQIAKWAAGKKIIMELGGNDPIVVMEDADLDKAAESIVKYRFGSQGQRCTSCKRAIIHESVYDIMKQKILLKIKKLKVGDPSQETTDIGPLIDELAAIKIEEKLKKACKNKAKICYGGQRNGAFFQPTLVENVSLNDELYKEETFGPVLPLMKFSTFKQAVKLVNSTPYGLQSGIFTNKHDIIKSAFKQFNVGAVVVNDGPGLRVEPIPFGGVKASGIGQEGIPHAIEEFTHLKTLVY